MAASSSANAPKTPTKVTATICGEAERSNCSCREITSKSARSGSRACTSLVSAAAMVSGLSRRWRMIAIYGNQRRGKPSIAQRRHSRERGRLHAGECLHASQQFVLETLGALRIVSCRHQIDGRVQHVARRKTRAGSPYSLQALQQEPRSDQQNETQRHLDENQA